MNFYGEYLQRNLVPQDKQDEIKIIDPAVSSTFIYLPNDFEDLNDTFGALHLERAKLVFLPINDNADRTKVDAGSHWTLLVMAHGSQFYYLDSNSSNLGSMPVHVNGTAQKLMTLT